MIVSRARPVFGSLPSIPKPILLVIVFGLFLVVVGVTTTAQTILVSAHFSNAALTEAVASDAGTVRTFANLNLLDPYVDSARVKSLLVDFDVWDAACTELAYTLFCLGEWLGRCAAQPISGSVGKPEEGRTHEDRRSRQAL